MRKPDWFSTNEFLLGCPHSTWGKERRHEAALVPRARLLCEGASAVRAIMPVIECMLGLYAAAYSIQFALVPITTISSDSLSMLLMLLALGLVAHSYRSAFHGPVRNLYIELCIGEFRWQRWHALAHAEVLAVLTPETLATHRRDRGDIMDLDGGIWLDATYLKVSFTYPDKDVPCATGYLRCGKSFASVAKRGTQFPIEYQKSRLRSGRYRVRMLYNRL